MSKPYKDWTSARAVSNSNREWKQMARLAVAMRTGRASQEWIETKEPLFTGIFKRLLTDPIELVKKEAS